MSHEKSGIYLMAILAGLVATFSIAGWWGELAALVAGLLLGLICAKEASHD